jgi:hypothetical protein
MARRIPFMKYWATRILPNNYILAAYFYNCSSNFCPSLHSLDFPHSTKDNCFLDV